MKNKLYGALGARWGRATLIALTLLFVVGVVNLLT